MNMAAAWGLPVVFVLENNHFGVSTRIEDVVKEPDLSRRAAGYGMPSIRVDGFDVLAVHEAATEAIERARSGGGPTLLVTESYRVDGHYAGEPEVYRDKAEVAEYRAKDPIVRFRAHLIDEGLVAAAELDGVDAEVAALDRGVHRLRQGEPRARRGHGPRLHLRLREGAEDDHAHARYRLTRRERAGDVARHDPPGPRRGARRSS